MRNANQIVTKLDQLDRSRYRQSGDHQGAQQQSQGTCVVSEATSYGSGSICDITLDGGATLKGIVCRGAKLAKGQSATWFRKSDGSIELTSGGGTGTTTTINQSNNVINCFGWVA